MNEILKELSEKEIRAMKMVDLRAMVKKLGLRQKIGMTKDELVRKVLSVKPAVVESGEGADADDELLVAPVDDIMDDLGVDKAAFVNRGPKTIDGHGVDELLDELNEFFAGRAIAKWSDANPNCIEFHGGLRQREDTTIHQPKKAILMYARTYVAPAFAGRRHTGLVEGSGGFDLQAMTPAEKKRLADELRELLADG